MLSTVTFSASLGIIGSCVLLWALHMIESHARSMPARGARLIYWLTIADFWFGLGMLVNGILNLMQGGEMCGSVLCAVLGMYFVWPDVQLGLPSSLPLRQGRPGCCAACCWPGPRSGKRRRGAAPLGHTTSGAAHGTAHRRLRAGSR